MNSQENGRGDEDSRKLFVGGIPGEAEQDDVQTYFANFGEVEMCTLKTDVYTGRSRGFGFLIFKDVESVNKVLNYPGGHELCGKKVDPKLATPQSSGGEEKSMKVFVGGIDKGVTKSDLQDIFSKRGTVTDVFLPTDKMTGEPKGFAFITFDNSEVPSQLCAEQKIDVNGKECDVKRANSKSESRGGGRGGFQRGGRGGGFGGGRGGGRGGYGGYGFDQGYGGYGSNYAGNSYAGSYDQNYSYQGGYGGGNYGGNFDGYGGGGFDQSTGYNYDSNQAAGGGYSQDQYKMKGARGGRGGGYTPY